jgi:hypothetical protein
MLVICEYAWLGSNLLHRVACVMNRAPTSHKEKILYKIKLNLQVLRELTRRSNLEVRIYFMLVISYYMSGLISL